MFEDYISLSLIFIFHFLLSFNLHKHTINPGITLPEQSVKVIYLVFCVNSVSRCSHNENENDPYCKQSFTERMTYWFSRPESFAGWVNRNYMEVVIRGEKVEAWGVFLLIGTDILGYIMITISVACLLLYSIPCALCMLTTVPLSMYEYESYYYSLNTCRKNVEYSVCCPLFSIPIKVH